MANSGLVATGGAATYGPSEELILQNCLPWLCVAMGILSINIEIVEHLGARMGDLNTAAVALLRWTAVLFSAMVCGCSAMAFVGHL